MPFSIIILSIIILSIRTHNIRPLSIMALSIIDFIRTLSINDGQHIYTQHKGT